MPIKVKIGSMEVELETVEQVAELARKLEKEPPSQLSIPQPAEASLFTPLFPLFKADTAVPRNMWDHETSWRFMSSLAGTAKAFMGHLIAVRTINSGELARKLGVEPTTLGPAIRSIKSKAGALGKKVPFDVKQEPGGAGKTYTVAREFYAAASQPQPPQSGAVR